MATWSDFFEYVIPDVPGCPAITAELAIKNAVIEFCEKSLILQEDHDPVTVAKGIIDYDLEPPLAQTLVVKIMKMFYREYPMDPISPDEVLSASLYNRLYPDARPEEGPPKLYTQKNARTFTVYPVPKETERLAITMRVALKPTRAATQVDDIILEEYAETIANGALSRLLLQPQKPYTNANLAAVKDAMFKQGLNVARQRAVRGYVRSKEQVVLRKI